jgi:PPIC-type PPIASE domain
MDSTGLKAPPGPGRWSDPPPMGVQAKRQSHIRLRAIAREPLLHFLLLGAALFLLDGWFKPATISVAQTQIVVSEARVRNLTLNFVRTWQRPPTREEFNGLVEAHIREEVMVREALALGLDRDDAIIRRRLQQKLAFVSGGEATLATPTDEQLEAYLKANADAFRLPPRATFVQVYLDPAKRKGTLDRDAARLLETLNRAGGPREAASLGDRLLLLEPRYEDIPQLEVARQFGADFAAELVKQPIGRWVGPLTSGYGLHLVRVERHWSGGAPALADVRPLVEREWLNVSREELARAFYEGLRAKYAITVQMPEGFRP